MYSNQLTQRHKLHRQLIDIEDRPCACGSKDGREVHRIIPGGKYAESNVLVRCFACHHFVDHPNSKFRVGSVVMLNGRTPARIDLPRLRPRTIIAIKYDSQRRCNYYLVGANSKGVNSGNGNPLNGYSDYWFRSYMLLPYTPRQYHFKRQYTRHNLATISSDGQGTGQTGQGIVD